MVKIISGIINTACSVPLTAEFIMRAPFGTLNRKVNKLSSEGWLCKGITSSSYVDKDTGEPKIRVFVVMEKEGTEEEEKAYINELEAYANGMESDKPLDISID